MTRKEEIINAAYNEAEVERQLKMHPQVFEQGFVAGAKWADRTMIDKVYDWLEFYLATAVVEWDEELTRQSFLDELMRKMKGGVG